jgi:hypothetical protein
LSQSVRVVVVANCFSGIDDFRAGCMSF